MGSSSTMSVSSHFDRATLEQRLRDTLDRPGDLTPRFVCFLEILLSEDREFDREEIKSRLSESGIGSSEGQAGHYLSNLSQFLTKKGNPHLRQIITFTGGGWAGAEKDDYHIRPEYRDLVQRLVDEWNTDGIPSD